MTAPTGVPTTGRIAVHELMGSPGYFRQTRLPLGSWRVRRQDAALLQIALPVRRLHVRSLFRRKARAGCSALRVPVELLAVQVAGLAVIAKHAGASACRRGYSIQFILHPGAGDRAGAVRNASVGSNLGSPNPGAQAAVRGMRAEREDRADARERMKLGFQADMAGMQDASAFQREQMRDAGADRRAQMQEGRADARAQASTALQRDELAMRREAQEPATRAAQRQESLYQRYEAAAAKGDQRAMGAIAQQIRDLGGKAQGGGWKPVTLQGGTDAQGNRLESVLGAVNEQTGEMRRYDQQKTGTGQQFEKGLVYVDGQGRRARFNGSGWEPA